MTCYNDLAEDEPSTSSNLDNDWKIGSKRAYQKPAVFQLNLEQKQWIKSLIPAADRARISTENLFFLLHDLITLNGGDIEDVVISPTTIARLRQKLFN